jgi:hypothetical protein
MSCVHPSLIERECVSNVAFQFVVVTLSESSSKSVLPVVLASPLTSHFNVISTTNVYSFFPSTASTDACIRTDHLNLRINHRGLTHLDLQPDNRAWTRACGAQCPARVCKTTRDSAVGMFHWNAEKRDKISGIQGVDYLLAKELVIWRFSMFCRNPFCPSYIPFCRKR